MCWEKWEQREFFTEQQRQKDEEKEPVTWAEEKFEETEHEPETERELTRV